MKNRYILGAVAAVFLVSYAAAAPLINQDGLIEYTGKQREIVAAGKTEGTVAVAAILAAGGTYGVGACEELDGEFTLFEGKPYVTKVRGDGFIMDHSGAGMAIFAAWTKNTRWRDEPVPAEVRSYLDLQQFVKERAEAAGIAPGSSFPFLMSGLPVELQWHINVDRTAGQPITRELFKKSKVNYVMQNEEVDIVGFYSEQQHGVFIGTYAPAAKGAKNALHIHLVSRDGKAAGHIDDITLAGGMTLRLPK